MVRVCLLFLGVIFGIAFASEIQSNFYSEESCAKVRGYCVLETECSQPEYKTFKELCSNQKSHGAICCKNFPPEKVNCYQTHNDCRTNCPKNLDIGRKGCPNGETCCVLV